jgi:hypothetical protein
MSAPRRRAVALLVVLAAVVLVTTGAVLAIAALGRTQRAAAATDDRRLLADLLAAGEVLAGEWIRTRSGQVVLDPRGGGICVAHDRVASGGLTGEVQVDCYDLLAMAPADRIRPHGPLRVAMALDAPRAEPSQPGVVASSPWLEGVLIPAGARRFPGPLAGEPVRWGERASWPSSPSAGPATALAVTVSPQGDGRINLNTAPLPLLREVYQQLHLGDVERVAQRRQAGERSPIPAEVAGAGAPLGPPLFTLVEASDRWAALITVATPQARRSWWVVFAITADKVRVVQRHDADR